MTNQSINYVDTSARFDPTIETVNGFIIGDYYSTATLHSYEDGSQQGPRFTGSNDAELTAKAKEWFESHGGKQAYPNGLEMRIRD